MKIKNLKFKIIYAAVLTSLFMIHDLGSAHAQEISVGIDPAIIQIEAKAPSLVKTPINIQNQSNQNITYSIFLLPFKAGSLQNGQPEFDKNLIDQYKDLFGRVQVSDENGTLTQISLAPKQKKDLTLSIRIPKGEPPKDYYFSVIFISEAFDKAKKESFVGARAGIGTNVLLSIGPKSPTKGHIEEFSGKKFLTKGPAEFKLSIKNESSHYITPQGNLVIKNIFGQTVGNINFVPANILAGSTRLIESENNPSSIKPKIVWNEKFLLGIYKADLTISLSEEGPIFRRSLIFFAFPAEAVVGIILALILLLGIIKRARSKYVN